MFANHYDSQNGNTVQRGNHMYKKNRGEEKEKENRPHFEAQLKSVHR